MTTSDKVTIFHKELTKDGIIWTSATYEPFRQHIKKMTAELKNDNYKTGVMHLRIKTDQGICNVGDMIDMGESLASAPSENAWEVYSVTENFSGSDYMHHVNILAGR